MTDKVPTTTKRQSITAALLYFSLFLSLSVCVCVSALIESVSYLLLFLLFLLLLLLILLLGGGFKAEGTRARHCASYPISSRRNWHFTSTWLLSKRFLQSLLPSFSSLSPLPYSTRLLSSTGHENPELYIRFRLYFNVSIGEHLQRMPTRVPS